ncbi:MAG: CBS domain-containing protein [Candidatus Aenigmarchaeota archaeon]|nr:CBS domain-containing protein [Candidatus Aenigmarchaeota archaeon]
MVVHVQDVMHRRVITVDPSLLLQEAAAIMADNHVGSLVVVAGGALKGILTERDLLIALAQLGKEVVYATVGDLMTNYVISVGPRERLAAALELMRTHHIKKLPVVEDGRLEGILTTTDIIAAKPELLPEVLPLLRGEK